MKKQLIYFYLILSLITGCQNNASSYELTIQITGNEKINKVYLLKEIGQVIDSSESDKNFFYFSGKLVEPQLCGVYTDIYPDELKVFILDYGNTNIIGQPSMFSDSEISFESKVNNDLRNHFQKLFSEYETEILTEILPDYQKAKRDNNLDKIDFYNAKLDSLAVDMRKKIYEFVETNSDNHGMAEVISEELIPRSYLKPEEFQKVYNLYSERIKQSFYGNRLKVFINELNSPPIKVGEQIIDFTMNDAKGNEVSIKDFKGKYVLIDFWASWCGPCRNENPNLVEAYKTYNSKGFEIIGVSLDTDEDAWLKAIEKDNLNWTNISDLKGWNNELAQHYKIDAVPTNMLLDGNGKIIELDLLGKQLLDKLNELFDK